MNGIIIPQGQGSTYTPTQTDTASSEAVAAYCSGLTLGSSTVNGSGSVGGTGGSTSHGITLVSSASNLIYVMIEVIIPAGSIWAAGSWSAPLNVTTAASSTNATLTRVDICRLNSSNVSQAMIGTISSSVALNSTGVKSLGTISGSAQTPSAGDKVVILYAFSNASSMTSYTPAFTFNQNFACPFYPQNQALPNSTITQAINRASFF